MRVRTRRLRSLLLGIANSLRLDGRPNAHDRAGPRTDACSEIAEPAIREYAHLRA
jgi:hypothetical protein